jgi:5-methylcytosine-specific restriction protein A
MREVPEWIGKTDDAAIPLRVQLRVYNELCGCCMKCGRWLRPGHWSCDHIIALVNGGQHRESNLQALCNSPCHSDKTRADVAEKSDVYAKKLKHIGVKKRGGRKIQSRGFERRIYSE